MIAAVWGWKKLLFKKNLYQNTNFRLFEYCIFGIYKRYLETVCTWLIFNNLDPVLWAKRTTALKSCVLENMHPCTHTYIEIEFHQQLPLNSIFPTCASNMEMQAYMLLVFVCFQSVSFWSLLKNKMITGLSDINQHLSQIRHSQLKVQKLLLWFQLF